MIMTKAKLGFNGAHNLKIIICAPQKLVVKIHATKLLVKVNEPGGIYIKVKSPGKWLHSHKKPKISLHKCAC